MVCASARLKGHKVELRRDPKYRIKECLSSTHLAFGNRGILGSFRPDWSATKSEELVLQVFYEHLVVLNRQTNESPGDGQS